MTSTRPEPNLADPVELAELLDALDPAALEDLISVARTAVAAVQRAATSYRDKLTAATSRATPVSTESTDAAPADDVYATVIARADEPPEEYHARLLAESRAWNAAAGIAPGMGPRECRDLTAQYLKREARLAGVEPDDHTRAREDKVNAYRRATGTGGWPT